MKKGILCIIMLMLALCLCKNVRAQSADDYDYSDIEKVLADQGQNDITFSELVSFLLSGKAASAQEILSKAGSFLFQTVKLNGSRLFTVISLTVFSVLFVNFTQGKHFVQVSAAGKYVTYILLITNLAAAASSAAEYSKTVLENMCQFLNAFIPVYFMSMSFSAGAGTASTYYGAVSFTLWAVEWGILHLLFPVVLFYMTVVFLNYLWEKDYLTKTAELLEIIVNMILKGGLSLLLGLELIQSMIAPYLNGMGVNAVKRVISMIPGAGSSMSGVAELVLGGGMIVKNGIGAAGMVMLVIILAVPYLELVVMSLMYHLTAAVLQPIGEERITDCVSMTAKGMDMILRMTGYCGLLFFISIAMMTGFSNIGM